MSFRELRLYTETMKSLGYPRPISLDNFRTPNFELVADCLQWLIHRISPDSSLSDDISTESERVRFLQSVAAITLSKTRTRLNLKKLYAADGAAVRELLKLAQLLHKATHTVSTCDEEPSEVIDPLVTLKLLDASAATAAARQVVRTGPSLHDGLAAEGSSLKDSRLRALAAAQDTSMVEASIQEALSGLSQGLASLEQQLGEAGASEAQLNTRLDKWTGELERAEKRLATLAGVRPPYMDEYEALTGQLQVLWLHYLERFRNLQYLEAQLDSYQRAEQDAAAAAERKRKKLQQRLADEELRILRGEQDVAGAPSSSSRGNSGNNRRGTASGLAGGGGVGSGGTDSGSSSDAEGGAGGGGSNQWRGGGGGGGVGGGLRAGQQAAGPGPQQWGNMQQQQQQAGGGGGGKVIGSMTAGWDQNDDDSIGDDDESDSAGGVLSHGGGGDSLAGDSSSSSLAAGGGGGGGGGGAARRAAAAAGVRGYGGGGGGGGSNLGLGGGGSDDSQQSIVASEDSGF